MVFKATVGSPLTPDKLRLSSTKPSMRSPSSTSRTRLPRFSPLLPALAASEGGSGAADEANEEEEVDAHRWLRRIDDVSDWISCRSSVGAGRSVRAILSRLPLFGLRVGSADGSNESEDIHVNDTDIAVLLLGCLRARQVHRHPHPPRARERERGPACLHFATARMVSAPTGLDGSQHGGHRFNARRFDAASSPCSLTIHCRSSHSSKPLTLSHSPHLLRQYYLPISAHGRLHARIESLPRTKHHGVRFRHSRYVIWLPPSSLRHAPGTPSSALLVKTQ